MIYTPSTWDWYTWFVTHWSQNWTQVWETSLLKVDNQEKELVEVGRESIIQEAGNLGRWWTSVPQTIFKLPDREPELVKEQFKNCAGGAMCEAAQSAPIITASLVVQNGLIKRHCVIV